MSKDPNVIVSNEPGKKPLPNIDKDNEDFYEGLKRHQFLVWRCKTCGASYWPKAYCQNHANEPFAANMEWAPASGRGKIFAFNRHHMAFHPAFKDEVPYVYALESAIDELAEKLGIDPVEFRRINDTRTDPIDGKPYSSRSLMKCYDEAAEAFGLNGRVMDEHFGPVLTGDEAIALCVVEPLHSSLRHF